MPTSTETTTEAIPNAQFFERQKKELEGGGSTHLWIAVRKMTKEEARVAYPYRPYSKYAESRFGGNNLMDDIAFLLNQRAARCKMCAAPTRGEYLIEGICPDCDGRSECNGTNPHLPH